MDAVPAVAIPSASRVPIDVLSSLSKELRNPALSDECYIQLLNQYGELQGWFPATKPSRLAEIIRTDAWVTPSVEVIPAPPTKCKHGLREAWCAACIALNQPGVQNPHRDKYLDCFGNYTGPLSADGSIAFDGVDSSDLFFEVGENYVESADFLANERAEEERSAEVAKCAKEASRVRHKAVFSSWEEACISAVKEEILAAGRAWKAAYAARVANQKKQTLAEYVAAKVVCVMLPGLRNGRSIRVREPWEIAAYNAKWTAKNNRKLAARGWIGYSPEAFDREILVSRGSVTDEAIKQFDRNLSRRGNKYRIS